jgi:uncharacterized damage-inducible protein DinB
MTILEFFLEQLELEAVATRKMLSRVPGDKFDWKPHEKSMAMRNLAVHVAELPSWVTMTLNTDELDFAKNEYKQVPIQNAVELVAHFEKCLAGGKESLKNANEADLEKPWTLRNGEQIYDVSPKLAVIRMSISQLIHHRAQLGVYLRLLNIPIPGSYGPSADENDFK